MAADRITFLGHRDYTGEDIHIIINRLEEFHTSICNQILILEDTKDELNKLRDKIDDPDSIIKTIDYFCILFRRFREDFKRLIDELPSSVQGRHLEIIKQITERLIHEKWNAIEFSIKHTGRALKDESLRPLLNDIYVTIQRVVSGFPPELGSMHARLKTFLGSSVIQEKAKPKRPDIQTIDIPPGTKWENLHLIFKDSEFIEIRINNNIFANKNYVALEFLDKRCKGKSSNTCKYNRLWLILAAYGKYEGVISWKTKGVPLRISDKLKKNTSDLRRHLKALFDIQDEPIIYLKKLKSYKTRFRISLFEDGIFDDISGFLAK